MLNKKPHDGTGQKRGPYKEKKYSEKFKIFVDLDDTLVDLSGPLNDYFGVKTHTELLQKYSREDIEYWFKEQDVTFWTNLKPMSDFGVMWYFLKRFQFIVISVTNRFPGALPGKIKWIVEYLGPVYAQQAILLDTAEKGKYASSNSILIDDYDKNCNDWVANGGIAIKHENAVSTLKQLKSILRTN